MGSSSTELRLVTIPVSHYCEKARWALELADLPYRELRHIQFFHYGATLWHARSLFAPALITPSGCIKDSTDILHFVDTHLPAERRLFPTDPALCERVEYWEDLSDTCVGVELRRWMYQMSFEQLDLDRVVEFIAQGVPAWQRKSARWIMPWAERFARWRLAIRPEHVRAGIKDVRRAFALVGETLADGRRYLVADRFTAADLSFAALSAFVTLPEQYGVRLVLAEEMPEVMRELVDELRASPAGQFARRIYGEHRPDSARPPRSPSVQPPAAPSLS